MPPPKGSPNTLEGPGDYDVTSIVHSQTYPAIDPAKADYTGRAVFVSGGSKGLGRAMVLSYAKAGASYIAAAARSDMSSLAGDVAEAAKAAGRPAPKFLPVKLEVTDVKSVADAAALVQKEFGRLDVLVNNAGLLGPMASMTDSDPDTWWNIWEINIKGLYLVSRSFIPLLLKTEGGRKTVVNVSSVGAHLTTAGLSAYQPSKTAVLRLSDFMAQEYGSQGLVSYCIHPGNWPTDAIGDTSKYPEAVLNALVDEPEMCGDVVAFLTSEKRDWLSARYINVTWDMPELMAKEKEIVAGDKLKLKFIF